MVYRVLVAHASSAGSTAEVAAAIGEVLRARGLFQVDVLPVAAVPNLAEYDALILGSAIHNSKVLPEAYDFVTHARDNLAAIPVAYFLVCAPFDWALFPGIRGAMRKWLDPLRQVKQPIEVGLFAGKFGPTEVAAMPWFWQVALKGIWALGRHPGQTTDGDWRDWQTIHMWAAQLADRLTTALAEREHAAPVRAATASR